MSRISLDDLTQLHMLLHNAALDLDEYIRGYLDECAVYERLRVLYADLARVGHAINHIKQAFCDELCENR